MKSEEEDIKLLARAFMAEANDESANLLEEARAKAEEAAKKPRGKGKPKAAPEASGD